MSISVNKSNLNHCYIGLINPKSPSNVGAIIRAAGCYDAKTIYYTGKRYDTARKFNTDTKSAREHTKISQQNRIFDELPESARKVAVELVAGATPLPAYQHYNQACYVFGPEDGTVPQAILDQCDDVVYIPTIGCMNLAATVNVLLYDRMAKSSQTQYGDDIIIASRDTNNRTRVS